MLKFIKFIVFFSILGNAGVSFGAAPADQIFSTPPRSVVVPPECSQVVVGFVHGDLLYGFNHVRKRYSDIIRPKLAGAAVTADDYNNKFWPQIVGKPINIAEIVEIVRAGKDCPSDIVNYVRYTLRDEEGQTLTAIEFIQNLCNKAIDYTVDKGRTIHFLLDDIEETHVISRKKEGRETDYTNAELRYIYEHRTRLQHHVQFYFRGQRVNPPWVDRPDLWRALDPALSAAAGGARDAEPEPPVARVLTFE